MTVKKNRRYTFADCPVYCELLTKGPGPHQRNPGGLSTSLRKIKSGVVFISNECDLGQFCCSSGRPWTGAPRLRVLGWLGAEDEL